MSAPTYRRPGVPEGKWWHPFAYLGVLIGASLIGWAFFAGYLWLVWAYTLVMLSITSALAAVVLVLALVLKRGPRQKLVAGALFCALVAVVLLAVSR